jgi:hypothetical protein
LIPNLLTGTAPAKTRVRLEPRAPPQMRVRARLAVPRAGDLRAASGHRARQGARNASTCAQRLKSRATRTRSRATRTRSRAAPPIARGAAVRRSDAPPRVAGAGQSTP